MQLNKIWPITAITIREGIRNRAMQGILFIAALLCAVYLIIIPLFAFDTGKVAVDLSFASITLAGLAIVIFLGIALMVRDIHQRSVCMILSRPIDRPTYVIGKFCGVGLTVLFAIVIIGGMGVLATALGIKFIPEISAPRNFSWGFLFLTFLYRYLSFLILMASAFLFTVLTTNEYLSMLFTISIYIIGNSLETIVNVLQAGEFFQASATYLGVMKFLTWILPNLSAFDLKVYLGYGLDLSWHHLAWTGVYGLVYIAVLLYLTIIIFNRKELR
ncbi:MAG: ABC transporter permease subunit [Desulfobacteraceae bacterium]|nr:ABC transporter permease subunit [Desulfobacteraceae bacterium]